VVDPPSSWIPPPSYHPSVAWAAVERETFAVDGEPSCDLHGRRMKRREFIQKAALGAAAVVTSTIIPGPTTGLTVDKLRRAKALLEATGDPYPPWVEILWESDDRMAVMYPRTEEGECWMTSFEKKPNCCCGDLYLWGEKKVVTFFTDEDNTLYAVADDYPGAHLSSLSPVDGSEGD